MKKSKDEEWVKVGGEGIWTEYKNVKTGESTMKNLGKIDDLPGKTYDCDHYYELCDPHGNSIQCQKCGLGGTIVWGLQILRDGKIIINK
jgi:predicted secreted protein